MSLAITAYQNRTTKELITFYGKDAAGNTITPTLNDGDKVRIKIGRGNENSQTPLKDITSDQALGQGTSVTKANPATFEIVGTDFADMRPGVYDIEAIVVDSVDSNRPKLADEGIFTLIGTQGGAVT
jgi:hypothetical protein